MPVYVLTYGMTIFGRMEMTTCEREERCCGCLHVRFATILLGCYLVISNTAFILFAPPLRPTAMSNGTFYMPTSPELKNTPAMKENLEYYSKEESAKAHKVVYPETKAKDSEDLQNAGGPNLGVPKPGDRDTFRSAAPLRHFVQCAIAMMLVYGAYSYKSMYLMPFICVRFFDLLRFILNIAGWLTTATRGNVSKMDEPLETPGTPNDERDHHQTNDVPPSDIFTSSYGFSIGAIFYLVNIGLAIYTLNIGFKCYKYILRHNRSVARAAAGNNGQPGGGNGGGGVLSFWGPDGSVNPLNPNADPITGEPQAEEDLAEEMPGLKLPEYSEVARDPEGKKYQIVTIPPNENASQTGCSSVQDMGPPPSFSEVTAAASDTPIDEPPPCYDDVSIGVEAAVASNEGVSEEGESAPSYQNGDVSTSNGSHV